MPPRGRPGAAAATRTQPRIRPSTAAAVSGSQAAGRTPRPATSPANRYATCRSPPRRCGTRRRSPATRSPPAARWPCHGVAPDGKADLISMRRRPTIRSASAPPTSALPAKVGAALAAVFHGRVPQLSKGRLGQPSHDLHVHDRVVRYAGQQRLTPPTASGSTSGDPAGRPSSRKTRSNQANAKHRRSSLASAPWSSTHRRPRTCGPVSRR